MRAPSYGALVLAYLVVQIFNNAAAAAFSAMVPDVVPEAEFGKASGILAAMVQLGSVCGLLATLLMSTAFHHVEWTYGVLAVVILASLIPTLWASRAETLAAVPKREAEPFVARARRFLRPLAGGDFAWVIYTRTMITAGIWCIFPFLQLFFRDVVRAPSPENFTAIWQLLVLLVATPFGVAGGWLSDRRGRKPFVYAAGAIMGAVVIAFAVVYTTQTGLILLAGALYGVGYGLYFAVDWALAIDTLPERASSAKDMGLFHVAVTLPQVVVPAIAGTALDFFNQRSPNAGYRAVFVGAIAFYVLGTVFVSRIRSVR
jgi:MFS family permease